MILAIAISSIVHVGIAIFAVEGDETEAVGDEFVGEYRSVNLDLDDVDGHGGDFCKDGAAEGVCKGEVDIIEDEVRAMCGSLRGRMSDRK